MYLEALQKIQTIQQKIAKLSPSLTQCYPVAIAFDENFLIYDVNQAGGEYQFLRTASVPMEIPPGIRAAFQLADLSGRIACVITPDVFESIEGYVTIFHEFVHCYQFETCEEALKHQLDVAQKAREVPLP